MKYIPTIEGFTLNPGERILVVGGRGKHYHFWPHDERVEKRPTSTAKRMKKFPAHIGLILRVKSTNHTATEHVESLAPLGAGTPVLITFLTTAEAKRIIAQVLNDTAWSNGSEQSKQEGRRARAMRRASLHQPIRIKPAPLQRRRGQGGRRMEDRKIETPKSEEGQLPAEPTLLFQQATAPTAGVAPVPRDLTNAMPFEDTVIPSAVLGETDRKLTGPVTPATGSVYDDEVLREEGLRREQALFNAARTALNRVVDFAERVSSENFASLKEIRKLKADIQERDERNRSCQHQIDNLTRDNRDLSAGTKVLMAENQRLTAKIHEQQLTREFLEEALKNLQTVQDAYKGMLEKRRAPLSSGAGEEKGG